MAAREGSGRTWIGAYVRPDPTFRGPALPGPTTLASVPRFSVIVPVYQVQDYLTECLESVLGQAGPDLELIAVDDRSPDGCGAVLDAAAAADPRVRVLHLPDNVGLGRARNAGLEVFGEPILISDAVVIRPKGAGEDARVDQFLRRLQGVLVARRYVLMDYDIRAEKVGAAVALTPGLESPTVSPLHTEGWVAVRSMVLRKEAQQIMDDLWGIGARAILVTNIHACRL